MERDLFVLENCNSFYLNKEEADTLVKMDLLVVSEDNPHMYEVTAFLWNDLDLKDDQAFYLFERILGRTSNG